MIAYAIAALLLMTVYAKVASGVRETPANWGGGGIRRRSIGLKTDWRGRAHILSSRIIDPTSVR